MLQPTPIPLNDASMLRIIRELAQEPANVFVKKHARMRIEGAINNAGSGSDLFAPWSY